MQLDPSTPEILTAKRVVTEGLNAFSQQALDIVADGRVKSGWSRGRRLLGALFCERAVVADESGSGRESDDWNGPP